MDVAKFFSFDGRISIATFWALQVFTMMLALIGLVLIYGGSGGAAAIIGIVVSLVGAVVGFATQIKRWHDRDKSGWWCLLSFVPFGSLWVFVETGFFAGTRGANSYGIESSGSPFVP